MKFSSLQENLSEGLQIVFRAIPTRGPLPILSNVLISTEKGRLKLAATNLETAITTYVGAEIEEGGSVTVPAKLLKDFIGTLAPSTIDVHVKDDIFHIVSEKSKSKFNGINPQDFPELPNPPSEGHLIEIQPGIFQDTISSVAFASGNDDTRPIFTGTYIKCKDGKLTVVSSDGFRLSEKTIDVESDTNPFTTVIPTKILMEVGRIFSKTKEPIRIALNESENLAIFMGGDTFVATRILDGQYPDYKQIIPQDINLTANLPTDEFVEAVKLTSIIAKEDEKPVKIVFDPENSIIKVSSLSKEMGEHESTFSADITGDLTEMVFRSRYLLDFLNNIKSTVLTLKTSGNTSACIFESDLHDNYVHIVMPMQI